MLPDYLAERLTNLTARTPAHEKLHVNVAVCYGGRWEIVDAVRELLHDAVAPGADIGKLADDLTVDDISRFLYTPGPAGPGPSDSDLRGASGSPGSSYGKARTAKGQASEHTGRLRHHPDARETVGAAYNARRFDS